MQHELNGYPADTALPEYRIFHTRSQGFFADRLIGQATLDIPLRVLPKEFREVYSKARMGGPISQYEELIKGKSSSDLQLPWLPDLAQVYGGKVSPMQCLRAWQVLPRAALVGLIDTVKTRVLSMALDIEAENPNAGDIPGASSQIPDTKVAQIFNTNIYGGQVQNLAAGSSGTVQNASIQVSVGDAESLKQVLKSAGVSEVQIEALIEALRADKQDGETGIGQRVGRWLSNLGNKAGDVGQQTVVAVATQALIAFMGLGA